MSNFSFNPEAGVITYKDLLLSLSFLISEMSLSFRCF